jgi:hypothetical protein
MNNGDRGRKGSRFDRSTVRGFAVYFETAFVSKPVRSSALSITRTRRKDEDD